MYDEFQDPYTIPNTTGMSGFERLMMHMNNKRFYSEMQYLQFLAEEGINGDNPYNPATMNKRMLKAVLKILNSLAQDIDYYRQVEGQYGTLGAAKDGLFTRIKALEDEIASLPLEEGEEPEPSNVVPSFWSSTYRRKGCL